MMDQWHEKLFQKLWNAACTGSLWGANIKQVQALRSPLWKPFSLLMSALFKSNSEWSGQNKMQLKGSRSIEKGFHLKRNGWASSHTNHLSGTSGQNLPEPCQKGQGSLTLSPTKSYIHPFPRNQRWHFQSWIQTSDLRNVVHYAVDWKKAHIVQADFFLELIFLLCLLPPKRCQQSELPFPKLAVPTSSWGQS